MAKLSRTWTLVAVVLVACGAAAARAETINVDLFYDKPDADLTDGVCDADLSKPGEQHTLRAAIQHANVTPGTDTILLVAGTYKLTIKGAGEDEAATGDLDVTDDIVLLGPDAKLTIIDGKKAKDRIFDLKNGASALIFCVTLRGGKTAGSGESGGALRNQGDLDLHDVVVTKCKSGADAGGIQLESGAASLSKVWVTKCKAAGGAGGIGFAGGTFDMSSCVVSKCKAREGGGVGVSGAVATLTNCTVSGNKAAADGGGLTLVGGGTLNLVHCTVAFNKAPAGSGVDVKNAAAGTCNATNTIVAMNAPSNSNAPLVSFGGNVDSGATCGFGLDDRSNANPLLLKLALNGASLPTHALKTGSPAIGLAIANCHFSDARGVLRTPPCDSGAFQTPQVVVVN